MMNRRQLREQIFKLLFRVEFNAPEDMPEQKELFLVENDEFDESDQDIIDSKYTRIMEKLTQGTPILFASKRFIGRHA